MPIEQIERLQEILPDKVDWIFEQTTIESEARRKEVSRINSMVFIERIAGLLFALLIAVLGLGLATYLAMHDHDVTASIIGGSTLVGLVTAFVVGKKGDSKK